ncbi:4'-phosphopantetheinyl transferase family protein [Lentzea flaviverrucosa]|uniref:4'-phosphopantetheinyl transferase EntD (Siderophore biosynthesis) n=1 Tax=Lentzea flaviverrucosa TaxID=200379 RepID=A0A1H9WAD7_9PSEU|nr:4'-phosphopantetheinyl transferase superfamily protein [Lentzea flaviverrucosa]RDI22251.1 4'-phosphopantetheinyl transferase EntD [Lentzea flaviverrucosa]SES30870.1 4'-phosphopantetheinyl transferase EntD (siderophore biosynthesis) [Lentzea flaviverrucosa]
MLEQLFPPPIAVVERYDDDEPVELFPEEEAQLGNAVPKRRFEFGTVRACAREAMRVLDVAPAAILPGPKREPLWPDGIVGSLTHCAGYRAAALARTGDFETIGIDAEPHLPAPDGVLGAIAIPAELGRMAGLKGEDPKICWDRLLFSAKETTYKAWFPVTRRWLGFEDADITLDAGGTFHSRILLPDSPIAGFDGRWLVQGDLLVTAIAVPARQ